MSHIRSLTAALAALLALTLVWRELPSIRRYIKIEKM